jgi:hypothetical protein
MSFWKSEIGEITGNENEAFSKSFKTIPDSTKASAKIASLTNQEYQGRKYLQVDWELMDGDFRGRKVSQKLKVFDEDAKAKHRALNMLKLMYDLFSLKPKNNEPPTDADLLVFCGKKAGIKIQETDPNEEGKQYNWVSEVHKQEGFIAETGIKQIIAHHATIDSAFEREHQRQLNKTPLDDIPF